MLAEEATVSLCVLVHAGEDGVIEILLEDVNVRKVCEASDTCGLVNSKDS